MCNACQSESLCTRCYPAHNAADSGSKAGFSVGFGAKNRTQQGPCEAYKDEYMRTRCNIEP